MLDLVVSRRELKETLARALRYLLPAGKVASAVSGVYAEVESEQRERGDADPEAR